ncbi:MAG: acyl-CoA dehydratase activase [Desulfonauticus sp.]|nr:acyl-CoA dehydratase activase [Desulfonauticus sp.]
MLYLGIDLGSTTAKLAVFDEDLNLIFQRYIRHRARVREVLLNELWANKGLFEGKELSVTFTGSAAMGLCEETSFPFVQEVVAATYYIKNNFPEVKTFVDIGGEDSKIVFFDKDFRPDMRMNGACAGGTGAFIDQMASLLNVSPEELDKLAGLAKNIYPIASRCGVFAKTDIQALMSRKVPKEDIAGSIFHSVVYQVISALSRGRSIEKKVIFGGGPLSFFSNLRKCFARIIELDEKKDLILDPSPYLIPAKGSILVPGEKVVLSFDEFINKLKSSAATSKEKRVSSLPVLFKDKQEFDGWYKRHATFTVPRISKKNFNKDTKIFIGVDSGSTTTKIVAIDEEGKILADYYTSNNGDPISTVSQGFKKVKQQLEALNLPLTVNCTCATGYGEALIKSAFSMHLGIVETMAHFRAASYFEPKVSFILDIGGQDMKAIKIENGVITDIELNEACSSGCGSFIETFAKSLGYSAEEFAKIGILSKSPYDLGIRCTVFMNSRVKQALKEGAAVEDISAGLAYSVIKNALYKVLKLKDSSILGDKIVVQGGTFKNNLVLRALEKILQREVIRPDIVELMGAYGAALYAKYMYMKNPDMFSPLSLLDLISPVKFNNKVIHCKGCENRCEVMQLRFKNNKVFYTGNRCERIFNNEEGEVSEKGKNLIEEQRKLLFNRNTSPEQNPILTYGIPRVLNMYEEFPFWCTLLVNLGFKVKLSSPSTFSMYEKGLINVMSDSVCLPAKLVHGHIIELIEKGVDKIFYPIVVYEFSEFEDAINNYNCPVVTGYPDVIKNSIKSMSSTISIDNPSISFKNLTLTKDQLYMFFKKYKISYKKLENAFDLALLEQKKYREELRKIGKKVIEDAKKKNKRVIVVMGRPYHIDPLINHGIDTLLSNLGVDVITERHIPIDEKENLKDVNVLTQWEYSNLIYAATKKICDMDKVDVVHITSFGCGPDAVVSDELKEILNEHNKIYTLIKMDEIANLGAVKIRLRSMLEAIKENRHSTHKKRPKAIRVFHKKDKKRTLIVPYFSPFYSPLIPYGFKPFGYRVEVLPPQSEKSLEWGLKSVNNDMCYPAILVAGDVVWAFKSGRYKPEDTAVILTQTGGQCRASNYVALVKKALYSMGYTDVPVLAIANEEINPQPGFEIDRKEFFKRIGMGVIFGDFLARMYLAMVARERIKGSSKYLHSLYLRKIGKGIEKGDFDYLLEVLKKAVDEFNRLPIERTNVPKVGVVGEIFVKYNFFSNQNLVEWLVSKGVEVELPPIQNFFAQRFINEAYDQRTLFKRSLKDLILHWILEIYAKYYLYQVERVFQKFRFASKEPSLRKLASFTEDIVSLANQAGEGWLLTAEMISMLKKGVNNIICLQPFGCISNHITGKGVEMGLKERFPELNLLAIDLDAGTSEVNVLNRLHIMLSQLGTAYSQDQSQKDSLLKTSIEIIPKIWLYDVKAINNHLFLDMEKCKSWIWKIRTWEKIRNKIKG